MIPAAIRQVQLALRSSFTRSVGGMMIFTAIGQSFYLLAGPAIGHIFSPAEFGLYGLFYTFAVTAVGLIFLNFDFAIPAAANDEDARCLTVGACAIASVFIPLCCLVLAILIIWDIAGFGTLPLIAVALLLLLLASQAIVQLLQGWRVRRQQAIIIGKSSITLNLVRGLTQVLLGIAIPAWWSLAIGEISGRIANAVHLMRSHQRYRINMKRLPGRWDVSAALRSYKDFPTVLLPAQVMDSMTMLLQSTALAYIYGPAGFAIFFLMRRTLDMPVAFVFRSLSDIFYARLAYDARVSPDRVRPFFVRSVIGIAGAGMLLALPFMFIAPPLFAFVFGEEWREAGVLAAIMAPSSVMNLAIAPVSRIFALTNRPGLRYYFSVSNLLGTALAIAAAYNFSLDLKSVTILISTSTFFAYASYFFSGYIASAALRKAEVDGVGGHS